VAHPDESPAENARPATREPAAEPLPPPPSAPPPPAGRQPGTPEYARRLDSHLLTPHAPLAPGAEMRVYPMPLGSLRSTTPARWAEDPSGRHQWRWWSGVAWTAHVADDGKAAVDRLR
jgi:hypothetical protein